jgi:6-phosphogluconolactonase
MRTRCTAVSWALLILAACSGDKSGSAALQDSDASQAANWMPPTLPTTSTPMRPNVIDVTPDAARPLATDAATGTPIGEANDSSDADSGAAGPGPGADPGGRAPDRAPRDENVGKMAVVVEPALESFVYVGGWDWSGKPYPFGAYRLDRASGALKLFETTDVGESPSFSTPSVDGRFLYLANESDTDPGVTTAAIDPHTGEAKSVGRQAFAGGKGLVFTSLDPGGKFVLAASYDGGAVIVYPIMRDGSVGPAVDTENFAAPSGESSAQTHSVRVHPNGKWAYAPNKALDSVAQFLFDAESGKLTANTPATLSTAKQSGPRHIALTPNGEFAFVSFETSSQVGSYRVGTDGTLSQVDLQSLVPSDFTGMNTGAHLLVHPSGKFVYASNRGHDSIALFALGSDGKLTLLQHVPSQGKNPRNFDIDKSGSLLVVANQGENDDEKQGTLAVFTIGSDGKLSALGAVVTGLKSPNSVSIITRPQPKP